jgi:hypothetical protein
MEHCDVFRFVLHMQFRSLYRKANKVTSESESPPKHKLCYALITNFERAPLMLNLKAVCIQLPDPQEAYKC